MPTKNTDKGKPTSSRSALAALAGVLESMAQDEPNNLLKAHRIREAKAARAEAAKLPIPQK